jgi:hypothetical protein
MNHQPRTSRWLVAAALIACAGCDDGAGDAEREPPRDQEEGFPCFDPQECREELSCVPTEYELNGEPLGVCARGCTTESDCDGETCSGDPASDEAGYCANEVVEYELCGVAETAICADDMVCLLFPDVPVGVCVRLCPLGAAAAADTIDEDAGVEPPGGCSEEQSCIEDVLAKPGGNGVCGTLVARGQECGIGIGLFCAAEDVCAPDDPQDSESALHCYQRCGQSGISCDEGTCTIVGRQLAYCL